LASTIFRKKPKIREDSVPAARIEVDRNSVLSVWSGVELLFDIQKPLCYIRALKFKKGVSQLPQRRTAIKELRKNRKHHMHNQDLKTELKHTLKSFMTTVESKNKSEAATQLKTVFKKLDKAAKRNIMHKKTADRRKSKFSRLALAIK
jgi:small subunit ribosomal protein S20